MIRKFQNLRNYLNAIYGNSINFDVENQEKVECAWCFFKIIEKLNFTDFDERWASIIFSIKFYDRKQAYQLSMIILKEVLQLISKTTGCMFNFVNVYYYSLL